MKVFYIHGWFQNCDCVVNWWCQSCIGVFSVGSPVVLPADPKDDDEDEVSCHGSPSGLEELAQHTSVPDDSTSDLSSSLSSSSNERIARVASQLLELKKVMNGKSTESTGSSQQIPLEQEKVTAGSVICHEKVSKVASFLQGTLDAKHPRGIATPQNSRRTTTSANPHVLPEFVSRMHYRSRSVPVYFDSCGVGKFLDFSIGFVLVGFCNMP